MIIHLCVLPRISGYSKLTNFTRSKFFDVLSYLTLLICATWAILRQEPSLHIMTLTPSFLPDSHPTVAAAAAGGEENASDDEWRCKLGGVLLSSLDDDDRM